MKIVRFYLYILFILATFYPLSAQFGYDMFTAKDGWTNTKNDYTDYELVTIFTSFDSDSLVVLDLNNGTADTWTYFYRNIHNSYDTKIIYVVKIDDYLPMIIDETDTIPPQLKKLDDINWMDSDAFFAACSQNSIYKNYLMQHQDNSILVYLIYNLDNEEDLPTQFSNKYVWLLEINEDFYCVMNALTGEIHCEQFTTDIHNQSVANDIKLFPQPASDNINLILPQGLNVRSIELFDLYGSKVYENSSISPIVKLLTIPVAELASGTYFLKINTGSSFIGKKVFVIK